MPELFLKLLNMSITASWLVLAVIALRLLLKRAPKWMNCALWGLVGLRLALPFSIESVFSLIPSTQTIPQEFISSPAFGIQPGIAVIDTPVSEYLGDRYLGVCPCTQATAARLLRRWASSGLSALRRCSSTPL